MLYNWTNKFHLEGSPLVRIERYPNQSVPLSARISLYAAGMRSILNLDASVVASAGFANETDHRKIEPKYLESVEFRVHASQSPGCEMT